MVEAEGGVVPLEVLPMVEQIAREGATPLVVSDRRDGEVPRILGVIRLKDTVKAGMTERFDQLRKMGIRTVMITGDNRLTAAAIAGEAGVDDFLSEATPEDKMALIRREQDGGNLVAMTGDGTNDAPALAQADVGLAMNTGTQAAKEAGNMVDLDSNPTKLIEVVEIGKQLLITRGSLTTFSIANDVAKYFAIIPDQRDEPRHAALGDPVGGHLQRLDHRGADPARPTRGEVPGRVGGGGAAQESVDLRRWRGHRPDHLHQAHRPDHLGDRSVLT
jgi:K+-transporting ATPase ATPase B chain